MNEVIPFVPRPSAELTSDSARTFATLEQAYEWGFTEHVGLSSTLDGRVGQNPTEFQQLTAEHGELALVRRDVTTFYDVLAKHPEQGQEPKISRARKLAKAIFKR